jgi:glycosyl-4,4'-diaponeurosporenoate acyltransferase
MAEDASRPRDMEGEDHLRIARLIFLNAIAWTAVHLAIAYVIERVDVRHFTSFDRFYRVRAWEPTFYRRLGVRRWKDALPDGAAWVGGRFLKSRLTRRDAAYLCAFVLETRRSEVAHWLMAVALPFFFLWNHASTWLIFLIYILVANGPCIITQRYNRAGLLRVIARMNSGQKLTSFNG